MKSYPKKIYISASWRETEAVFPTFLVKKFISQNVTVVGDHPDYKEDDPFDRSWIARIHKLISDCSALVAVFPERRNIQTTSPYMFPEIISAALHNIPILIFSQAGVLIKSIKTNAGYNLHFGDSRKKGYLDSLDIVKKKILLDEVDKILSAVTTLQLSTDVEIRGPYKLSDKEINIENIVRDFVKSIKRPCSESYVFNIIPFSIADREHKEISKAVFEETGLPCVTALDSIGDCQDMRSKWKESLSRAEFVIVELSQLRAACIFEAGVAFGMGSDVYILTKNKNISVPYGLDNKPLIFYSSISQLKRQVKEVCCKEYKRKVYNLDPRYNFSIENGEKAGGVPEWLYDTEERFTPILAYTASLWLISISLAIVISILFLTAGASDSPLSYVSMGISLVLGLVPYFIGIIKSKEEKILTRYREIFCFSLGIFFICALALVLSYTQQ
ncbi:MAG: hypothetical protein D3906_00280 [Candidatus Electrothrix sp. AUS1_2]|nr:hypothetical protein [Candidatus Electrothrix sp. AUS1_2]